MSYVLLATTGPRPVVMRTENLIDSLFLKKRGDVKAVDRAWITKEEEIKKRLAEKIIEETQTRVYMGTEKRKLKFQVVTYNVAELTKPDGADLTPILGLEDKPDVISIG